MDGEFLLDFEELGKAFPFLLSSFLTHAFQWEGHNLQMCGKFKLDSNRPGLGWEALFTTAETWKQPRCPSQDEWIKKLRDIHTMEYYSASVLWISKWGGLGQQMGRGRDSDNCLPRSSLPKFNDQEGRVFHRLTRGCAFSSTDTEGKGCDQAAWRSLVRGLQESWGKIVFHLPWWWKNLLVTEWEPRDGSSVASAASSFLHYFSFLFLFFSPPPPSSSSLLHNLFLWLLEMGDLKLLWFLGIKVQRRLQLCQSERHQQWLCKSASWARPSPRPGWLSIPGFHPFETFSFRERLLLPIFCCLLTFWWVIIRRDRLWNSTMDMKEETE